MYVAEQIYHIFMKGGDAYQPDERNDARYERTIQRHADKQSCSSY